MSEFLTDASERKAKHRAEVSERLKIAMASRGLKQTTLSDATGIEAYKISRYCNNHPIPGPDAELIARSIGIDPSELSTAASTAQFPLAADHVKPLQPIEGAEFKARREALMLSDVTIMSKVKVQRRQVSRWISDNPPPTYAVREMLNEAEAIVDLTTGDLVAAGPSALVLEPPAAWTWGDGPWRVAVTRARRQLEAIGLECRLIASRMTAQ